MIVLSQIEKCPNLGINIFDAVARGELMSSLPWVTRRSSHGRLYHVLEPPVSRIHDGYLDCVVYLYPTAVDAEDGTRADGSGFLVGVPSKGLRQDFWFLYAVTNKHVIKNATTLRLNSRDGKKTILPTVLSSWTVPPSGDDLAACLISFDPMDYKFNHVPRATFLSKEIVKDFNIGPGDDVFMVGRFINHEGRQANLPTVRFGNIGQMPWETIRQDDGFEQESFLVEVRSIGGYSGSPVFVFIPAASTRPGIKDWATPQKILSSHGPWLLGIDWGYINNWEPVCGENGEPVNPGNPSAIQVKLNTGMAAAVPAWRLAELLDAGPLAAHRETVEREVREFEAKNPPVATMNDGPSL